MSVDAFASLDSRRHQQGKFILSAQALPYLSKRFTILRAL